jgi:hypothetical protein
MMVYIMFQITARVTILIATSLSYSLLKREIPIHTDY